MLKVLLVNPWGVNNDEYYTAGFISGMNHNVILDFACNYYYKGCSPSGNKYSVFFKKSEFMQRSKIRNVLRGIEYIIAWNQILSLVRKNKYDIVHIHWLLMYQIDRFFLKRIKKAGARIVLTAHNVFPHVDGAKNLTNLKDIYTICDNVLVHGESIKNEFATYFPDLLNKVSVQFHGEYYNQSVDYSFREEPEYFEIKKAVTQSQKVFIVFGAQFYNKGTDRLVKIWLDEFENSDSLLLIMGKKNATYPELDELSERMRAAKNIIYIDKFVEDNLLNYAIQNSDCIVIPYRHASMSGIVYTAAAFSKGIICTRSGAIAEYLENEVDSLLCDIDDDSLKQALICAQSMDKQKFVKMGQELTKNIKKKYSWNKITDDLYNDVYCMGSE